MPVPTDGPGREVPDDGVPTSGSDAPTTTQELLGLLEEQHEELRRTLDRVPDLHGAAREDVFLQARRLLAVHETLERFLVALGGEGAGRTSALTEEVVAAEALDRDSPAFDRAFARIVTAHLDHIRRRVPELTPTIEALSDDDRTRVATAVRMWQGEGDAYAGSSYPEMLRAAEEQLEDPGPAPPE